MTGDQGPRHLQRRDSHSTTRLVPPTGPSPKELALLRGQITEIIRSGGHRVRKALFEALIEDIEIQSDDSVIPRFRIPTTRDDEGLTLESALDQNQPDGAIRALPTIVDLVWIGKLPHDVTAGDPALIDTLRDVIRGHMRKVDGVIVDATTANAIMTVWDVMKPVTRDKFLKLGIDTMVEVTWRVINPRP